METIFVSLFLFSSSGCLSIKAFTYFTPLIQFLFSVKPASCFLDNSLMVFFDRELSERKYSVWFINFE